MAQIALVLTAAAFLAPVKALPGQGWIQFPNGSIGYKVDYTTSGYFYCNRYFTPQTSCQANGSTITFRNGGSALTLSYLGVTNAVVASSGQTISLGTITQTITGNGPFVFPNGVASTAYYAGFDLGVTALGAAGGSGLWGLGLLLQNNSLRWINRNGNGNITLPTTTPPPSIRQMQLVVASPQAADISPNGASTTMTGTALLTPEPHAVALLATGLAGTFGMLHRRRRR